MELVDTVGMDVPPAAVDADRVARVMVVLWVRSASKAGQRQSSSRAVTATARNRVPMSITDAHSITRAIQKAVHDPGEGHSGSQRAEPVGGPGHGDSLIT